MRTDASVFMRIAIMRARSKAKRIADIARNFGTYAKRYRAATIIVRAIEAAVLNPYTQLGMSRLMREFKELDSTWIEYYT